MNEWVWSIGGMILTGKTEVLREKLYTASMVGEWMSMEHWWNGTDRGNWSTGRKTLYSVGGRWMNEYGALVEWYWQGKLEYWERNPSQCHFVHHKSYILHIYISMPQQPPMGPQPPVGQGPSLLRLHDHTQTHTTVGKTPLGEWSALCRDLYLTTHNIQTRQACMPPAGFEPTIPACERPQTHALDRAATGIGTQEYIACVKHVPQNHTQSGGIYFCHWVLIILYQ
jgi:hypothetical protein